MWNETKQGIWCSIISFSFLDYKNITIFDPKKPAVVDRAPSVAEGIRFPSRWRIVCFRPSAAGSRATVSTIGLVNEFRLITLEQTESNTRVEPKLMSYTAGRHVPMYLNSLWYKVKETKYDRCVIH